MQLPRASGILLHPTSLPGRHGIGDLGPEAHAFVDFLAETGQTWWQILPLGPIGYGDSPYQSPSSFAGNPLLDQPRPPGRSGLARRPGARRGPGPARRPGRLRRGGRAQVGMAAPGIRGLRRGGRRSGLRGVPRAASLLAGRLRASSRPSATPIDGQPWYEWEPELVAREPEACARWREQLAEGIRFHEFVQYAFEIQWQDLRAPARSRGSS